MTCIGFTYLCEGVGQPQLPAPDRDAYWSSCPVCGRKFLTTKNGRTRSHAGHAPDGSGGAGAPILRETITDAPCRHTDDDNCPHVALILAARG